MPYNGFKCWSQKEIVKFCLNSIDENSFIRFILEVDLEYLDELHKLNNDFPWGPEKLKFSHNILSKCCSSTANKYCMKIGSVNKLVTNVDNKSRYVLHYRHFQLYLKSEMKLTKVHRIVKLKLSNWLKKRIDFNEDRRKDAVNSFEKDF